MDFPEFALVVTKHVRDFVQPALDALAKRIDDGDATLFARLSALPAPDPGKDGAPGADGVSVDAETVQRMIDDAVAKAVAALPVPKDGRDGVDGAPGADGRDAEAPAPVDYEQIERNLAGMVAKAFADVPLPKDGTNGADGVSPDPAAVAELVLASVDGEISKALAEIPRPTDGRDGRDGAPGTNGEKGADGTDGLGFDDLQVEQTDERTMVLKFTRGDVVKKFPIALAGFAYQGVFKEAEAATLRKGDYVTWGGSLFHVQKDAPEGVPERSADFVLAVKRGRDGAPGGEPRPAKSGPVSVR